MSAPGRYGWLLRLLPREVRAEYGEDMVATMDARAAALGGGRLRRAWFVWREAAGLLVFAVQERRAARARRQRTGQRKGTGMIEQLVLESRHAMRRLLHSPGFSLATVVTLALAIGANTAIFTLLHRIVLSPLPYAEAGALVSLEHAAPGAGVPAGMGISEGLYREYGTVPAVESLALYRYASSTLSGSGAAERLRYVQTTPSLATVLRVGPALGRWFTDAEALPGAAPVVVLSHGAWVGRFGGDPSVLGRTLRIDGVPREIIGVMPERFAFPGPGVDYYALQPLDLAAAAPGGFNYQGIARLRDGVSLDALQRHFNEVLAQLPERFPEAGAAAHGFLAEAGLTATPVPYRTRVLAGIDRTLWVLLGAVAIVLLIACANLANLFLVRTEARQREVAMRRALGATPGRIASFHFAESLTVALFSGVLGIMLAIGAVHLLSAHSPVSLPRLHEVRVDGVSIGFALLLAAAAGTWLGGMPLLRRVPDVRGLLQEGSRTSTAGAGRLRSRHALMGAQVALAVVLLVGATLMIQSFLRLQRVDPGFVADARVVFDVGLPASEFDAAGALVFHEQLLDRLRALPGVRSADVTTTLPLEGDGWGDPVHVRGVVASSGEIGDVVRYRRVSPSLLQTLGIPLLHGRGFTVDDMRGNASPVIVNEALVRRYFAGEDPLGREIRPAGQSEGWLTIVGVVGNTATYSMREAESVPKLYVPLRTGMTGGLPSAQSASFVVHADVEPLVMIPAIRNLLAELNPNVAVARAEPLGDLVARSAATTVFTMILMVLAGGVALLLGVVGVYAVIAYAVAQRTGEIGIRLALGASPSGVTRLIVAQSGRIIAIGVAAGIVMAAVSTRAMQALLYGVAVHDLLTYVIVSLGLFGAALLACWFPARRAAARNPAETLSSR